MLKILEFQQKLDKARQKLEEARGKAASLSERRNVLTEREKQLTEQVDNVKPDATREEQAQIEAEIASLDADKSALTREEEENRQETAGLEEEIKAAEAEIARCSDKLNDNGKNGKVRCKMIIRNINELSMEERTAFGEREDIKSFCANVRNLSTQNRAVTGAALLIPTVVLDIIRENIKEASKLYKYVRVNKVAGKARQVVTGTIPEAIWTEAVGKINALSFTLGGCEVDAFKVGGYISISNSSLTDGDNAGLTAVIVEMISGAIGYALDKAILYGTGTKMPLGIMPRLAQESAPTTGHTYSNNWKDVHSTNLDKIAAASSTGTTLFKELVKIFGKMDGKRSNGKKFFAMAETTYCTLQAEALSINAAGAVVSGMNNQMPVLGGDVVLLSFIPNNVIIGGYGDNYLLAEREGTSLESSTDALFTDDMTVFRGTARYDGMPILGEAFAAVALSATAVPGATAVTFGSDAANT